MQETYKENYNFMNEELESYERENKTESRFDTFD
jgi:hypothetical protein